MLNLNYNINKAIGGGGCIGVMKYNYSASFFLAAGGGGGAAGGGGSGVSVFGAGAGGGGAQAFSASINIIPNVGYQINIGGGGAGGVASPGLLGGANGQSSSFIYWNDTDETGPITLLAAPGRGASSSDGGTSGDGFTGGADGSTSLGTNSAGGGGGTQQNGENGNVDGAGFGGDGGFGGGGGGGAARGNANFGAGENYSTILVPGTSVPINNGAAGGIGGSGSPDTGQAGQPGSNGGGGGGSSDSFSTSFSGGAGGTGVLKIAYVGKTKATGGTITYDVPNNITTHTFGSGSSTFLYTYPYPWEDVVPYTVEVCPQQRDGFAPYIYEDPYSASIVSAIPGAVFKQGFTNLFGMDNIWDDISSYVRGTGVPIGSDRTITPSGSGTIVSVSATPWDIYGYPSSLLFSSNSLLNAGTDSGTFEGFNIPSASYSPSGSNFNWVAECWVTVPISSSFVLPNRSIVRKNDSYGLNLFSGINNTANVWQNNAETKYTGPLTASLTMDVGTLGSELIYQANATMGASGSNVMSAFQWHHIAFSSEYSQCDPTSSVGTHTIYRGFFDGREIFAAPINMCGFVERIPEYPTPQAANPALIFGDLFGDTPSLMQDFRFYKGTNKNYTASFDVNDVEPIVIARPY